MEKIEIKPINWQEYLEVRDLYHSEDSLKFDDPERPAPTMEDDIKVWNEIVPAGKLIIRSVRKKDGSICGIVNAFDIEMDKKSCEIGIIIFPKNNWNKGIGKVAVPAFIKMLNNEYGFIKFKAMTNVFNTASRKLFTTSGFRETGITKDGSVDWVVMEYEIQG